MGHRGAPTRWFAIPSRLMEFETPTQLAGRLKLGREEFAQRLLTSLILHAPYPKWNTPTPPGSSGLAFLERVHELSFPGTSGPDSNASFIDEFELAPRTETEKGGSPDYCVFWASTVWMIELKTERASHRAEQIPSYFELARHHHPDRSIALTYLTPPMPHEYSPPPWGTYAHLSWIDTLPIIRSVWSDPRDPGQRGVVHGLCELIEGLDSSPAAWRRGSTTRRTKRRQHGPTHPRKVWTSQHRPRRTDLSGPSTNDSVASTNSWSSV